MSTPVMQGVIAGLLLAVAAAVGGWSAFALAVFLGAVGGLVAAQASGRIDVVEAVSGRGRG
ncbi:DUF2273 domain-containing protein [Quadrisphaera setariae]|uniref:DUF2273 domain-containing protein n=1 Tax=Quadrisphaera setariae TaxID=2593304 RepID=A0A5C8ZFS9_9ACTN|nr:DUF2273 domain-containing protein [Quadrisphaera setariae]TXR56119.1 DUF2273 domain-containing protein [Quadrisphaera setariae]